MIAVMTGCMFLEGASGSFEDNGRTVEYQNGEFFQKDGGGSMKFAIDKEVPVADFQSGEKYDLTVDLRQFEYSTKNGSRKAFRARVVDAVKVSY